MRVLEVVGYYYNIKDFLFDTTTLSLGTILQYISDVDSGVFENGIKSNANGLIHVFSGLFIICILVGRALTIYYNIRIKRQEFLSKELDYKIKEDEHNITHPVISNIMRLSKEKDIQKVKDLLEEITEEVNKDHESYIDNLGK